MASSNSFVANITLLAITLISFTTSSTLLAQKGAFEEVEVTSFNPPFSEINISYFGTELPLIINDKTTFKGEKNKKITPEEIQEGTLINKLSYELIGEEYFALSIETDISADGRIKIYGLFEGFRDDKAIIDGYPVLLLPGVRLQGSKKNKCECSGLVVPNFESPLVSPGQFYVEIQGKMDEQGVINANFAELCRNGFGKPEQELLAAVNGNLTDATTGLQNIPADLKAINMSLYNGEIKVGQYSYKLTNDIKIQGYINQIGYKLLPARAKKEQANQGAVYYRFYVIDDPVPNAFAFPNGMIFIHTGLLNIIENEAQLAAVLGHEIAHVTHEHGRERYENTGLMADIGTIADVFFDKTLNKQIIQLAPSLPLDMVRSVNQLSKSITPAAVSNLMKPQTKMEAQADRVGLYYAYQAGYDIREAASFWNKMQELTSDQNFQSKITSDLMNSLKSNRLSTSNASVMTKLSVAGSDVLAKQILDTIYTSHPKAKKRAQAVNKLVGSVYVDTDWEKMKVNGDKYSNIIGK